MNPNKANYAFIDNENVNVSVQKQKWKIDRGKFRERLRTERNVEVAYMFMGYLEEYQPMYEFFTSLGYTLVFRPMNPNPDIPNKGNIDTDLVLHAMIERPNYNQAVIVSGDGDFASLVKHLNEQKKLATVIVPNERRYSGFLDEASGDKIVPLSLLKTTLRYKPSTKKKEEGAVRPPRTKSNAPRKELLQHTSKHQPKRSVKSQSGPQSQPGPQRQTSQPPKSYTPKSPAPQPSKPQTQKPQQASKPPMQNAQQSSRSQTNVPNTQRPAQQNFKSNPTRQQKPQSQQPSPVQPKPQPPQNPKPTTNSGNNKPRSSYKSNDDAFYA